MAPAHIENRGLHQREQQNSQRDPGHELVKAFLFLRTASAAVANFNAQIKSISACILFAEVNGDYKYHLELQDELEGGKTDIQTWKERLIEAQTDFVDWAARREIGRGLPAELLWQFKGIFEA